MSFFDELLNKVRASYPCIYVTAREDWRTVQEIQKVAAAAGFKSGTWTISRGWTYPEKGAKDMPALQTKDVLEVVTVDVPRKMPEEGVYTLVNFHRHLDDPQMIQAMKDAVQICKGSSKTLVLVCNILKVPPELMDDMSFMEFGLPDRDLIRERIVYLADSMGDTKIVVPANGAMDALIDSALGMTTFEAENALALSIAEKGGFDAKVISREKAKAVSKAGVLEFASPLAGGLSEVGGLDNLKAWLRERRGAFSPEAKKYGLSEPKGILAAGLPGTGKSLTAKAVAAEWGLPLLKFDLGKVFGSLVGASERTMREALQTMEAVAPCVVLIDEIEKGMAGAGGSGSTDSGVTARVFGTLITWMNDRTRPVFLAATCNRVLNLPPELMRAGRFDEIFWVDLPTEVERVAILAIHLSKKARDPKKFKLTQVAAEAIDFSGAELEGVVVKAMYRAFSDKGREVNTEDLSAAVRTTVPLARTRSEEIAAMREWAATRAVPASLGDPPEVKAAEKKRRVMV